jgi:hypothetical protein
MCFCKIVTTMLIGNNIIINFKIEQLKKNGLEHHSFNSMLLLMLDYNFIIN